MPRLQGGELPDPEAAERAFAEGRGGRCEMKLSEAEPKA